MFDCGPVVTKREAIGSTFTIAQPRVLSDLTNLAVSLLWLSI